MEHIVPSVIEKICSVLTEPVQLIMFLWIVLRELQGYLLLEKLKDATIAQTNALIKTDTTIDNIMKFIGGQKHEF